MLKEFGRYITLEIANGLLNDRMNVFHYAAKDKNIYSILFFYDLFQTKYQIGDCINKCSSKNNIKPIHSACYLDDTKTIEVIIDLGGDMNAVDYMQMTPLHIAVTKSNSKIAKKLILNGADKYIKNNNNKTPYELALNSNHPELIDILSNKNLYQFLFKCDIEYSSLKNKRKDHVLIIIILLALCIQLSFYILINNTIPSAVEGESYCLISSFNCTTEMICFVLGIIFELCLFYIVLQFTILQSQCKTLSKDKLDQLVEQLETDEKKSLSELYLTNEEMCIKCKKNTVKTTLHCISCDKCIDHWDHHCFYLNCCIHSGNKKSFNLFCIVSSGSVIMLAFNSIIYLILFWTQKANELISFMFYIDKTSSGIMPIRVIGILIFAFIIIGAIYTMVSMIAPFMLYAKENRSRSVSTIDSKIALINEF